MEKRRKPKTGQRIIATLDDGKNVFGCYQCEFIWFVGRDPVSWSRVLSWQPASKPLCQFMRRVGIVLSKSRIKRPEVQ